MPQDAPQDVLRELRIELLEPGADDEVVDRLAGELRLDLLELDVESVSPVALQPAPDGSKGVDLATVGALLVCVQNSLALVGTVLSSLRSWLARDASAPAGRSVRITVDGRSLELSAATAEQQSRLVEEFVRSLRPEP